SLPLLPSSPHALTLSLHDALPISFTAMCSWWTADGWADSGGQITAHICRGECNVQQSSSKLEQPSCAPTSGTVDAALHARAGGNLRWVICALLFFATTINYMDRQVLGLLAPLLQQTFGWSEIQYG